MVEHVINADFTALVKMIQAVPLQEFICFADDNTVSLADDIIGAVASRKIIAQDDALVSD